jgi:hypothetical protein
MKNQIVAFATFSKLGIAKLTAEFTNRENSLRRIFSELGKVFTAMIPQVPRGQTITAYLKEKGISQGTISNSQYASNAFALVVNGVIPESRYDDLTLRECQTISKVGAEKATAAFANRTKWRLELASLEKFGMTLAEHAADMAAKDQSKAAEPVASAAAETPAETPDETPAETEAEPEVTATPTSTPAETPAAPENVVAMPTNADPASVQSALQDRALVLLGELDSILAQAPDKAPLLELIAAMVETHAAPKARKRKAA